MFRRPPSAPPDTLTVAVQPSPSELVRWQKVYEHSSWRFSKCASGHVVDVYTASWRLAQIRGRGWYAIAQCAARVGSYGRTCESGVAIDLPVDPNVMVSPFPTRHESDSWYQAAAALPRLNGIYASHTHNDDSRKWYEGILFTGWGSVFTFDFSVFAGIFPPYPFSEEARMAMEWFGHPSRREERRGLFAVNGLTISFTAWDMIGDQAEYVGAIGSKADELKLQVSPIGHRARRPLRRTYKFHSLAPRCLPRL
jgi:hypothetical protein